MQHPASSLEALPRCSATSPCSVVAHGVLIEHSVISQRSGEKRRGQDNVGSTPRRAHGGAEPPDHRMAFCDSMS